LPAQAWRCHAPRWPSGLPLVDALKRELLLHPVLHADETPAAMLKLGNGKTPRAYLWSYCSTHFAGMHAVVFDFAESRAGHHARGFLGVTLTAGRRGAPVCDDFSGYEQLFFVGISKQVASPTGMSIASRRLTQDASR
jgi:transposase